VVESLPQQKYQANMDAGSSSSTGLKHSLTKSLDIRNFFPVSLVRKRVEAFGSDKMAIKLTALLQSLANGG
jgi:hypothetical protein